jgi:hypothetical protein
MTLHYVTNCHTWVDDVTDVRIYTDLMPREYLCGANNLACTGEYEPGN